LTELAEPDGLTANFQPRLMRGMDVQNQGKNLVVEVIRLKNYDAEEANGSTIGRPTPANCPSVADCLVSSHDGYHVRILAFWSDYFLAAFILPRI